MQASKFHLGWFMNGYRVHGWRDQWIGTHKSEGMLPEFYVDMARSLERACFDYFIIEDSSFVPTLWEGKHDFYVKNAYAVPKFDPVRPGLDPHAEHSTARDRRRRWRSPSTRRTCWPGWCRPWTTSRTAGPGWNMVTASSDRAAQNYGHEAQPDHDVRYEMAEEFTDLVTQLWESWEPGAMVVDQDGIFADPTRCIAVDFEGSFYKSRGPMNSARSPQGRPVIVQAGGSAKGRAYASRCRGLDRRFGFDHRGR